MIEQFLNYLDRQGKSEHTIRAYRQGLAHFSRWIEQTYNEPFDPQATIPRDVVDWRAYQQTTERASIYTINQRLAAVRQFFSWCIDNGHVTTSPVQIKSKKPDQIHPKALSDNDYRRLLRAVHKAGDLRDIALIELMLGTGLRVSEVISLRRDDIILNHRNGSVTVAYGKYGKTRTIPIPKNARDALRQYIDKVDLPAGGSLWAGLRGALKDPSAINRLLRNYCEAAKIEPVTPHQLRHTYATRYLQENPDDLRGLASLLGHSSLDTLMIYTEPTEEEKAARVENL